MASALAQMASCTGFIGSDAMMIPVLRPEMSFQFTETGVIVGCHDAIAAFQDFGHQPFQALFLHLHNQAQAKFFCKSRSFRQGGDLLAARTKSFQLNEVQLLYQPLPLQVRSTLSSCIKTIRRRGKVEHPSRHNRLYTMRRP